MEANECGQVNWTTRAFRTNTMVQNGHSCKTKKNSVILKIKAGFPSRQCLFLYLNQPLLSNKSPSSIWYIHLRPFAREMTISMWKFIRKIPLCKCQHIYLIWLFDILFFGQNKNNFILSSYCSCYSCCYKSPTIDIKLYKYSG